MKKHGISVSLVIVKGHICLVIRKLKFKGTSSNSAQEWNDLTSEVELARYSSLIMETDTSPCIFYISASFYTQTLAILFFLNYVLSSYKYFIHTHSFENRVLFHSGAKKMVFQSFQCNKNNVIFQGKRTGIVCPF